MNQFSNSLLLLKVIILKNIIQITGSQKVECYGKK